MPPQQRNENVVDTQQVSTTPMRRITSESEMSEAGDSPRGAREYRVRKSSLIGYVDHSFDSGRVLLPLCAGVVLDFVGILLT